MARPGRPAIVLALAVCGAAGPLRAQCPDGTPLPCGRGAAPAARSVAVLDFLNESRDTADAYLADGFTDEITSRLGQVERLVVTSRTAVRRLPHAATLAPPALGRALGVQYLVSGGVRRGVRRVRVSVELLRASSGVALWANEYDRPDGDLLSIEQDIATAVAGAIAGRLLPAERATLAAKPTSSATAYDHFLRGNWYLAQRTGAATQRAIAEYQAATAEDAGFVQARARTAYAYALYLDWGWAHPGLTDDSMIARGMREADLVLQQDSQLSDGWMARAYLLSRRDQRTFAGAAPAFQRAIALDPRNAEAYHQYAWILMLGGRDSAAASMYRRALAADPARGISLDELSLISFARGRYAEALALEDSALAVEPAFWAFADRGHSRLLLGDLDGAREDAEVARRLATPQFTYWGASLLALVAARRGDTSQAGALAQRAASGIADPGGPTVLEARWIGGALAAAGRAEAAIALLATVPQARRGAGLWFFLHFPEFETLRSDPRVRRLMAESRPDGAPAE